MQTIILLSLLIRENYWRALKLFFVEVHKKKKELFLFKEDEQAIYVDRSKWLVEGWVMYVTVPVMVGKKVTGLVFLSHDINDIYYDLKSFSWRLLGLAFLVLFVVIVISYYLAGKATAPLKELTKAIQLMGQGYLRQRLDVRGTDEVACLATLLERLVYNLLDNALKYTNEKGSIEVNLYQAAEEIVFEVVDTGMGIPEHAQNLVWQRFFRLDKARSREQGGSGLGLSLVRQITELHRAQIDLISEEGVGTKIKVIFPGFNNL